MHSSVPKPRYLIAAAGLLLVATVSGDPPSWWSEGDPPVIDPAAAPNNQGPANIGQAKWMAKSAIDALRPINSDLALAIEQALVGDDKIIRTLAPPADDADREKNHAPLLIGQLKAIASPFYDALHTADPVWLETQLADNKTKDLVDSTNHYPWTQSPTDDRNHAIANIGQLKAVFSLRFQTLDADQDGLFDNWERRHFGNLTASGREDSDNDGLDNAQEQDLGTNPQSSDSDDDGIMDAEDADPVDEVIDWRKTPEPSWVARDLSNLNVTSDWILTDLSDNGTMLFSAPDQSIRLVYELQPARTLANAPNSQFFTSPFSGILHGDRVFGRRDRVDDDGFVHTEWVYLDPSNNEVVLAGVDQNNPPEHIWDATSLNVSGVGGGNTVDLHLSSGFSGTRFESNENAVAASAWAPLGYAIVKYWTYADGEHDNGRFIPFPIVSRFTPETQTTATFRQTSPGEDEIVRHIIPSGSGVYVAKGGEGFRTSGIAVEKHSLFKPFSATSQGWLVQVDEESVPKVWANGKWHLLKHLVGRNASGEYPVSVAPVKICDNGQMVARIRYPSQAGAHYALLTPATATELSPQLVDNEDQIIPGSGRPNYLRRDINGNVLRRLSTTNAMVERDPTPTEPNDRIQDASTCRIAWREVRVKIGNIYEGKTVEWSMTPQFTPSVVTTPATSTTAEVLGLHPNGPRFRGSWSTAAQPAHQHRFAASNEYGDHEFETIPYANGEAASNGELSGRATTVVEDGHTAIRVNLPPIGFNKARISIRIDGSETKLDLLDLEVPAVVVIDPGHGRVAILNDSSDGATGLFTGVRELDTVLDIGNRIIADLKFTARNEDRLLKVYSTKSNATPRENVSMANRLKKSRNFGADTTVSLHFDAATSDKSSKITLYRNPFAMIDMDDAIYNRNPRADWALGLRIRMAVQRAIANSEPIESIEASANAYEQYNLNHPITTDQAEVITSEIAEQRNQHGLWCIHDGTNVGIYNGNYRNSSIRYIPDRATLIEIERIHNKQADILFNENTSYNVTTGEIVLTETAEAARDQVSRTISRSCINDVLIRNLADRETIPERRHHQTNEIIGRLDYEED
jgi:N-acetylmuramoyl-L-alanine amidase